MTVALDPEGEGKAFGGSFFVTLKRLFVTVALGEGVGLGFTFGDSDVPPSITVTLSFWPGTMLFTVTEATFLSELIGGVMLTGG